MEQSEILVIKEEAKKLLEKFSKSLESVRAEKGEWNVEREADRRKESSGGGLGCDSDFRKIVFENAPSKDSDFLIAEKKTW